MKHKGVFALSFLALLLLAPRQRTDDHDLASPYSGVGDCPAGQAVTGLSRNAAPACSDLFDPIDSWPVGSVFVSVVATNPSSLLGGGTWVAIGAGRALIGLDSGDTDFDEVEETGGSKTVTLTEAQIPSHTHGLDELEARSNATGAASTDVDAVADASSELRSPQFTSEATGGGEAHPNVQPYLVVYFWKRTA